MSQYTGSAPDTLRSVDWRDRALCATPAGHRIDWFPHPTDETGIAAAQAVCAACPVAAACLRDALAQEGGSHPEYRWGVRGGLTGDQRFNRHRTLVRARGEAEPALRPRIAKCGTVSGYQKHLREKTEPCTPCRTAKNEANRKQRKRKRKQPTVRQPIQCGTRSGYRRHHRNGEEACEPCRIANTQADRRLRNTGTTLAST